MVEPVKVGTLNRVGDLYISILRRFAGRKGIIQDSGDRLLPFPSSQGHYPLSSIFSVPAQKQYTILLGE
jgi:hypothetical protein